MNPAIDWQRLYQERAARLKRLIELNAPQCVVYMTAKTLLLTEFHNSTRRMLWRWFVQAVRRQIASWRADIGIFRLRRAGWSRTCAIDIYFGDAVSNHKKTDCDCAAGWEEFERKMREVVQA